MTNALLMLEAMAEPTRRAIVERLVDRPGGSQRSGPGPTGHPLCRVAAPAGPQVRRAGADRADGHDGGSTRSTRTRSPSSAPTSTRSGPGRWPLSRRGRATDPAEEDDDDDADDHLGQHRASRSLPAGTRVPRLHRGDRHVGGTRTSTSSSRRWPRWCSSRSWAATSSTAGSTAASAVGPASSPTSRRSGSCFSWDINTRWQIETTRARPVKSRSPSPRPTRTHAGRR